jgi:pyruvate/2-oxoglutarate/acetoin dehydrogenase E1 component/TPP-dependent pyruvate/acetoin dehydrogenase alpha subunit
LSEQQLLSVYELMLTARTLDARLTELARSGEITAEVFPTLGREAALVGLVATLEEGDVFAGSPRDHVSRLAQGDPLDRVVADMLEGAEISGGGGDGGTGSPRALIGDGPSRHRVAAGCAMAMASRGESRVVMAQCREDATADGAWHESVNTAAVLRLPVVFCVHSGEAGRSGPSPLEYAAHRADGYGIPGIVVDGTDVLECIAAAGEATDRARRGGGPTLIEAVAFRRAGRTALDEFDPDPDELASWEARDPIDRFEEYLGVRGLLDEARRSAIRGRLAGRVADSIAGARSSAGTPSGITRAEYAEAPPAPARSIGPAPATLREAVRRTIELAMAGDERVVVVGRSAAASGGATSGLLERYGPTRVFDVPGSAAAAVGAGIGAALEGMRPVVEIAGAELIDAARLLGGWAGRHHRRTGATVPLVVRVPFSPEDRLWPEAMLPEGVKVAVASTPETASGLLHAAIADPNPVVVLEPALSPSGPVEGAAVQLGTARIVRSGREATLVAWGAAVATALEACASLPDDTVEVIDLVSLAPVDWDTVLESVRRTSRLVVLDGGLGGAADRIAARVASEAMWDLDGPVLRLAPRAAPSPPTHADAYLLTPVEVAEAVRSLTST